MDIAMLDRMLKMLASPNDSDAVMGLRGVQGLFQSEGATLEQALSYAAKNIDAYKQQVTTIEQSSIAGKPQTGLVNASGMPDCRVSGPGQLELILPGQSAGEVVVLPGVSANDAGAIATGFKDALAAAVINKSRFKLKLTDVKNGKGEIVETVLQAVYEREGMTPVRVWSNVRGEVAALAAVLRKAVANTMPQLVAA